MKKTYDYFKSGCFSLSLLLFSLTLKCLTFLLGPILNIQFDNYTNHSDDFFTNIAVVTFYSQCDIINKMVTEAVILENLINQLRKKYLSQEELANNCSF